MSAFNRNIFTTRPTPWQRLKGFAAVALGVVATMLMVVGIAAVVVLLAA